MSFILVTGASGFVASHIIQQLLAAGHKVRGTVRSGKAEAVRKAWASYGDKFQVVLIEDIGSSDLTDAFKDVKAVIHVASSMDPTASTETILKSAIDGTTRVFEQALASNVHKIIVTSSSGSLVNMQDFWSGKVFTEKDWNSVTKEQVYAPDASPFIVYLGSKKLAEETAWKFAKEHPKLDVATVIPTFVYGPAGRGQTLTSPAAGTNTYIYELVRGTPGTPRPLPPAQQMTIPSCIHVSDVARAHVLLLDAPPASEPKRILLKGTEMRWRDAVEYIAKSRPELKDRLFVLPKGEDKSGEELKPYSVDGRLAEKVIGMKEYTSWQKILNDTLDDVLRREKELGVVPT